MKMKIFAGITAVLMVSSSLGMTASATTIYGDVNNDNIISLSDIICLNRYLKGISHKSTINAKYSDVDKNTVLDICDVKTLSSYIAHTVSSLPYTESSSAFNYAYYDFPSDESRNYSKYNCATVLEEPYSLSAVSPVSMLSDDDDLLIDSSDNAQCIVKLEMTDDSPFVVHGSGFIVSDHVIATAAHNVYASSFFNNYSILVYNAAGDTIVATYNAKEVHVPVAFMDATSEEEMEKYDYALIYVEEDLSAYGTMALGITTNNFPYTAQTVYASGFPGIRQYDPLSYDRYYSIGNITTNASNFGNPYRLFYTAPTQSGDSGGPIYIEYTLNGNIFRSAIGIHSQGRGSDNFYKGTRITQPLLRFYNNNPNIG